MHQIRRVVLLGGWGLLVLWCGCGPPRLSVDKSYTLDVGEARAIDLDPQSKPQKIQIEFTASDGQVEVLMFKKEDVPTDQAMLDAASDKALARQKGPSGSLSVDLPEKVAARIVIRNPSKKAEVKVKVKN